MLTLLMSSDARSRIADEFSTNEPIYFAPKAELNQDAMVEYNLDTDRHEGGNSKSSKFEGDIEFLERFDGRGRKVRIKKGKIEYPFLKKIPC